MRTYTVTFPQPFPCDFAHLIQRPERVKIQHIRSARSVKACNKRTLRRLSGLNKLQRQLNELPGRFPYVISVDNRGEQQCDPAPCAPALRQLSTFFSIASLSTLFSRCNGTLNLTPIQRVNRGGCQ
ncbi:uncharacterized protein EpC_28000 [Erwinia pyrifoliae Ep1/96]|nr:uncharacterized protein EpC_28000 [Erwinia pyrifoliae Ep1/96]